MKESYLIINIAAVLVPFLFSFHPKIQFYKKWPQFFTALIAALAVFLPWDMLFTSMGIWGFNPKYVTGLKLINLPIEEVLFFLCIPYACVFSYHCFDKFVEMERFKKFENPISITLIIFLTVVAIFNYSKLYTSVTFTALVIFIILLKYVFKVAWLHKLYFSYLILIIPFFIVNGLLTGSGLEEAIVWYDNNHNLGIRMLTIPFEDTFYGLLLLMITVFVYELQSAKLEKKKSKVPNFEER